MIKVRDWGFDENTKEVITPLFMISEKLYRIRFLKTITSPLNDGEYIVDDVIIFDSPDIPKMLYMIGYKYPVLENQLANCTSEFEYVVNYSDYIDSYNGNIGLFNAFSFPLLMKNTSFDLYELVPYNSMR